MEIGSGRLAFTPEIEPLQVGPSALDLRLGNEFTTFKPPEPGVETIIDLAKVGNVENALLAYGESRTLSNDDSFILRPGQFVLTYTLEYIKMPDYLAARVEGRSPLARLGVSIH